MLSFEGLAKCREPATWNLHSGVWSECHGWRRDGRVGCEKNCSGKADTEWKFMSWSANHSRSDHQWGACNICQELKFKGVSRLLKTIFPFWMYTVGHVSTESRTNWCTVVFFQCGQSQGALFGQVTSHKVSELHPWFGAQQKGCAADVLVFRCIQLCLLDLLWDVVCWPLFGKDMGSGNHGVSSFA